MIDANQIAKFSVRDVVGDDLLNIYNLICDLEDEKMDFSFFEKVFRENLNDSNVYYFAAVAENCIIGFISLHIQRILHHNNSTGEIQELIISPHFQGLGVGTMLMQKVESLARDLKLEELEITTRVYRERAQIFYKQLGYLGTHYKFVKKFL
jgi:(aminoalkyl)phosphonate N-acetyltransferase